MEPIKLMSVRSPHETHVQVHAYVYLCTDHGAHTNHCGCIHISSQAMHMYGYKKAYVFISVCVFLLTQIMIIPVTAVSPIHACIHT